MARRACLASKAAEPVCDIEPGRFGSTEEIIQDFDFGWGGGRVWKPRLFGCPDVLNLEYSVYDYHWLLSIRLEYAVKSFLFPYILFPRTSRSYTQRGTRNTYSMLVTFETGLSD